MPWADQPPAPPKPSAAQRGRHTAQMPTLPQQPEPEIIHVEGLCNVLQAAEPLRKGAKVCFRAPFWLIEQRGGEPTIGYVNRAYRKQEIVSLNLRQDIIV